MKDDDPASQRFLDVTEEMSPDEELMAESFKEKHLRPADRKAFEEAKGAASTVWIENAAWRAVPEGEAQPDEIAPARFLQRWKPTADGL